MVQGSTPYVGMAPKKMAATLKVCKWHGQNVDVRLIKGFHEHYQALSSASMNNGTVRFIVLLMTSQMIYHRGGEPEPAMHCWFKCHGTQAMDNSKICHRLLFRERGKQNFVQPFLRSMKLLMLHTCFN